MSPASVSEDNDAMTVNTLINFLASCSGNPALRQCALASLDNISEAIELKVINTILLKLDRSVRKSGLVALVDIYAGDHPIRSDWVGSSVERPIDDSNSTHASEDRNVPRNQQSSYARKRPPPPAPLGTTKRQKRARQVSLRSMTDELYHDPSQPHPTTVKKNTATSGSRRRVGRPRSRAGTPVGPYTKQGRTGRGKGLRAGSVRPEINTNSGVDDEEWAWDDVANSSTPEAEGIAYHPRSAKANPNYNLRGGLNGSTRVLNESPQLWITDHGKWVESSALPPHVLENFTAKFHASFKSNDRRMNFYELVKRKPQSYFINRRCMNNLMYDPSAATMTFTLTGGNKARACDRCHKTGRLCVRVEQERHHFRLGVYPLHESYRNGKSWDELEYWMQPEEKLSYRDRRS